MPGVSAERVRLAKEVDLLTYLSANEPHELRKTGANEYRTATHSSLVLSKGLWFWNRGQVGGRSAIDFLIKVRGMGFVDAVEKVLDGMGLGYTVESVSRARSAGDYSSSAHSSSCAVSSVRSSSSARASSSSHASLLSKPNPQPEQEEWVFRPPRPEPYSNKAVAYLQQRGISPKVINRVINEGIFFESRYFNTKSPYHNAAVCVFAGKDESGKMVYAALRGIDHDFKKDKAGSDKSYNFTLSAKNPNSRQLFCFEAPIDLLSHATLQQRQGWNFDGHRLSLGGTAPASLLSFLERNPKIKRVVLHLDNDSAGVKAFYKIKEELANDSRFKSVRVSYNPPRHGAKDYNDALLRVASMEREQKQEQKQLKQPNRREADFSL